MNEWIEVIKGIAKRSIESQTVRETDVFDGEEIICGVCGKKRRFWNVIDGESVLCGVSCDCDKAEKQKAEDAEKQRRFEERCRVHKMNSGLEGSQLEANFEALEITEDNERNIKICKSYSERFAEMLEKNQGLLMIGDVGTGKTWTACCIANKILDAGYTVSCTSFAKLLIMSKMEEEESIRKYVSADLLIIDDMGTERQSDYALEKIFKLIDERYKAHKPVIYTTNITLDVMKHETDIRYRRLYDRIFETCYPMEFKGKSWRKVEANKRFMEMKDLLEGV